MKKDLTSFKEHDKAYEFEKTGDVIKKYDEQNLFKKLGFEFAINITSKLPETHLDIGSGTGWLLRKTSPYFKKVIGIEPSSKAIELAKTVTKDFKNIEFRNQDMVEALEGIEVSEPVFITTATVLNHIENKYVSHFLKLVNDLPEGSVLFFDERYDENIDWKLWHIRSKDWWRNNLLSWQLVFLDIDIEGYSSGIYGVKNKHVIKTTRMQLVKKVFWLVNMLENFLYRVFRKFK